MLEIAEWFVDNHRWCLLASAAVLVVICSVHGYRTMKRNGRKSRLP